MDLPPTPPTTPSPHLPIAHPPPLGVIDFLWLSSGSSGGEIRRRSHC